MTDKQKRNEKLTRWRFPDAWSIEITSHDIVVGFRDGHFETGEHLTDSLDACFKWLVPKVIDKIMAEQGCSSDIAYAILFKKWLQELELIIPNVALALCLTIEKLIGESQ